MFVPLAALRLVLMVGKDKLSVFGKLKNMYARLCVTPIVLPLTWADHMHTKTMHNLVRKERQPWSEFDKGATTVST